MVNFNFIAPFYDTLAKIVFGKELLKAKTVFITELPERGTILYIGGGSGLDINTILTLKPTLEIDFIEASSKFIAMAKATTNPDVLKRVNFIIGTEKEISKDKNYVAIITFFILDVFPQNEAFDFCNKINLHLQENGVWLFADFVSPTNLYQQFLLRFMFKFFRIVTNIKSKQLPDYDIIFQQLNYQEEASKYFYNKMVCAKLLRKKVVH